MHKIALTILLIPAFQIASGQDNETHRLYSGANFLTISPDARAGAMGAMGVATASDAYSIYWNAAKAAFNEASMEVSYTYSPWMREVSKDINLSALGFVKKIGDNQAITAGFRYFSYGEIDMSDHEGVSQGNKKPYEMSFDLAYARKLGENLSAAVTLKYIHSQLGLGQVVNGIELSAANAVAADISVFFDREVSISGMTSKWRAGLQLANIGSKLKYGEEKNEAYLPGDLRLGTSLETYFNERNSLMLSVEGNGLMVPRTNTGTLPDKSGVGGYFSSFGDLQSDNLFFAVGAEYWYAKTVALRAGYHHGSKDSGKPTYFSAGFGVKYFNLMADFSYIAGISDNNPIRNSLQFSVGVNLDFFKRTSGDK